MRDAAPGHFVQTAQLVAMLPPAVPARQTSVPATGVLERLIAARLLWVRAPLQAVIVFWLYRWVLRGRPA